MFDRTEGMDAGMKGKILACIYPKAQKARDQT